MCLPVRRRIEYIGYRTTQTPALPAMGKAAHLPVAATIGYVRSGAAGHGGGAGLHVATMRAGRKRWRMTILGIRGPQPECGATELQPAELQPAELQATELQATELQAAQLQAITRPHDSAIIAGTLFSRR